MTLKYPNTCHLVNAAKRTAHLTFFSGYKHWWFKSFSGTILIFYLFSGATLIGQPPLIGNIMEVEPASGYAYVLHKPSDLTSPKPLIIFLHGSGEKGNNLELVKVHGPFKYLKNNYLDAYVLAPQCPVDEYWSNENLETLIRKIIAENKIDHKSIHLTGLSMGAWGAWNFAVRYPEILASLMPIAGFVDRTPMLEACDLKEIPTRIYHGLLDETVDAYYSIEMYKRMKACSDQVELTIFEEANHDSWTKVYNNPEIYLWMLGNRKK